MKIGIDGSAISGDIVGGYSYMFNLIKNLLTIDKKNEFVIYCRKEIPAEFKKFSSRVEFKICGFKKRKICEQIALSAYTPFDNLALLHCCWSLPLYYRGKSVLTAHGLAWRVYPQFFNSHLRLYWKFTAERTYPKATRLIAISESTKNTFRKYLKIDENKIDVVHHGIDLSMYPRITDNNFIARIKKKYNLPETYILFVSALLPVKNVSTLIKAFDQLKKKQKFKDVHLVIAGGKGWDSDNLHSLVDKFNLTKDVLFTGYFPQEDLPALYNAAKLFVLPSFYEGFGIPILEAFACGTPVITSNTSSLPEVAGEAGILFDPHSQDELADAIEKVLIDESLQQNLIEKGLKRAKQFSWVETAKKTLKVYEKALLE